MVKNVDREPFFLVKTLSGKQRKAIAALVSGMTQQQAAEAAGVHETTLSRWMQEPEFRAALDTAGERIVDAAGRQLLAFVELAIKVIVDVMNDQDESGATRVRAALAILDKAAEFRALGQLTERIEWIEKSIQEIFNHELSNRE